MSKKSSFFSEFKTFIMRGNVIDLAVGVIIGAAFQAIIKSLVDDLVMPVISLATKGVDFANKFIVLGEGEFATLAEAQEAGVAVFAYGNFINAVLNFLIMAFVIFVLVRTINKLREKADKKEAVVEAAPTTKKCPFCKSEIDIEATKCPNCTSDVE
ncbi:MAG: large conductance mechanosensitive channel protein MscL [Clostridia bacterium]|nr:large conductance mechanosensitive channel protein MscL [Clostridia bacterium]